MNRLLFVILLLTTFFIINQQANAAQIANPNISNINAQLISESNSEVRFSYSIDQTAVNIQESVPQLLTWILVPRGKSIEISEGVNATIGSPRFYRGHQLVPVFSKGENVDPNIAVEVSLKFKDTFDAMPRVAPLSGESARLIDELVINPRRDMPENYISRMLLLYPRSYENEAGLNAINDFANWKRRTGVHVDVVDLDLENMNQEDIRDYIMQRFFDETHFDYLVLVGYDNIIFADDNFNLNPDNSLYFPSFSYGNGKAGDLFYTTFDGNDDIIPDVMFSRLLAQNTDALIGVINRTILYERDPFIGNDDWYTRALVSVDKDDVLAARARDFLHWTTSRLTEIGYDNILEVKEVDYEGAIAPTRDALQTGVSLALGDGWLLGAVNPVEPSEFAENAGMNPVVLTNMVHYGLPITLRWFHFATAQNNIGPVAVIGFAGWSADDTYQMWLVELIGRMLQLTDNQESLHLSTLFLQGLLYASAFAEHEMEMEQIVENFGLARFLGDPTMNMRNAIPKQLVLEMPEYINPSDNALLINVTDEEATPIEGATVVVQSEGRQWVVASDMNGDAFFVFDDMIGLEDVSVTAVKGNCIPAEWELENRVNAIDLALRDFQLLNLFRNGSTSEIRFEVDNNGNETAENLTVRFVSNSPHITFEPEVARLEDIDRNESGGLSERVEVTASFGSQPQMSYPVIAIVTNGDQVWNLGFELTVNGEMLEISRIEFEQNEDAIDMRVSLMNLGDMDSFPVTGRISTNSNFVDITNAEVEYEAIAPESEGESDVAFTFTLDSYIDGSIINFNLELFNDDGIEKNIFFQVSFGDANETTPFGPDEYGYICLDGQDIIVDEEENENPHPENFEYLEMFINPNRGEELKGERVDLNDNEGGTYDHTAIVELPFTFRYYGIDYDEIVVCTNGWIAMGTDAHGLGGARSRGFGEPFAPKAQIAAFWTDLRNEQPDLSGVFTLHLEDNGMFIIEWDGLLYRNGNQQMDVSFQIILLDPTRFISPTGDGEVVIQYHNVNASWPGEVYGHRYPTIGIRNHTGDDGLIYYHRGMYATTARPIEFQDAIRFTTFKANEYGTIRGRIVSAANPEQHIGGVRVNLGNGTTRNSNLNSGNFTFNGVRAQRYEHVLLTANGYNSKMISFELSNGQNLNLGDIQMTNGVPMIADERDSIAVELKPNGSKTTLPFELHNIGNGTMDYKVTFTNQDGSRINYDSTFTTFLTPEVTQRFSARGGTIADDNFYFPGTVTDNSPEILVLSLQGELLRRFPQIDGLPMFQDLTFDGEKLWGVYTDAQNLTVKYFVPFTTEGQAAGEVIRVEMYGTTDQTSSAGLVWVESRNSFFASAGSYIYEFNLQGEILGSHHLITPGVTASISGLGWNEYDPEYFNLYIVEQRPNLPKHLFKLNPDNGEFITSSSQLRFMENNASILGAAIHTEHNTNVTMYSLEYSGTRQNSRLYLFGYNLGPNLAYLLKDTFENFSGTLEPESSSRINVEIEANGWPEGTYGFAYQINHSGLGSTINIPVNIVLDQEASVDSRGNLLPSEFKLNAVFPNPFNSSTSISFSLNNAAKTTLSVYDIQGRLVANLFDNKDLSAGYHTVNWDAMKVASGVYFVRLEAENLGIRTTKALLLR